jgi:hypothetical protein
MNVCVDVPPTFSKAMHRVAAALKRGAPVGVRFTSEADADLVVLHVIGEEAKTQVEQLRAKGQRVLLIQYCLRSTQHPSTAWWLPVWQQCDVVWSYYDLNQAAFDDGWLGVSQTLEDHDVCFVHRPLGVDSAFVLWPNVVRSDLVLTSGYVAESESVGEVCRAARMASGRVHHLGPKLQLPGQVQYHTGISDGALAHLLSSVQWVSGLRRCEGFELPAAEGLLCGARPILFDRPHYRSWFHDLAEFIPEDEPDRVTASLLRVFRAAPRPVSAVERDEAARRFHWPTITADVWRKVHVRTPTAVQR